MIIVEIQSALDNLRNQLESKKTYEEASGMSKTDRNVISFRDRTLDALVLR